MTESEWLVCTDPAKVLELLSSVDPECERKVRLFLCGFCRQIWHALTDVRSRTAVRVAERYADGEESLDYLRDAWLDNARSWFEDARAGLPRHRSPADWPSPAAGAAAAAASSGEWRIRLSSFLTKTYYDSAWAGAVELAEDAQWAERRPLQCEILRDIFNNPFAPHAAEPAWLAWNGGTVPKLAKSVYDNYAFDRLPLLADALEDAGCADGVFLDHCRSAGPHVRGCWVLDSLLGKGG